MHTRTLRAAGLGAGLLVAAFAAPASAKDFRPGDLRLCNATSCVPVDDPSVVKALSRFYYAGPAPNETRPPRVGAPYFQITFSNGYLTGVAATAQLDRFRSNGVNMGRFTFEDWYRVPTRAALGLRKLAATMRPLRVNKSMLGPPRYG